MGEDDTMPDKGNRKQGGAEEQRTVLQLAPVKYQITLYYLGRSYMARDERRYRCTYEFQDETGNALELLPRPLPNVVTGDAPDEDSTKAATPQDSVKTPTADTVYRLQVTDNHTLAESDSSLLGRPEGDNRSRPQYYRLGSRNWIRDVIPAAPFRIIVRKFQGPDGSEEQVDFDDDFKILMEIKDPIEEYAQHAGPDDGPVKECLRDFFKKYNRTDADPNEGDDNILTWFKGYRRPSDSLPGVRPANVIRRADHIAPPTPDTVNPNALTINNLRNPRYSSQKTCWAKFDLTEIEMQDGGRQVKIGMADFAFRPMPIGGDNYRFLFWLVDGSENDVRDTDINGAPVTLWDHNRSAIPKPRAYCCGRIVMWRKVDIRLLLVANGLGLNDIDWNRVKGYYRHVFTEISDPADTVRLSLAAWRNSLIQVFNAGLVTGDFANMDNFRPPGSAPPADPNDQSGDYHRIYRNGLFPPFMVSTVPAYTTADLMDLCKHILNTAVEALPAFHGQTTARDRNIKQTGEGIYVLYAKANVGGLLGFWAGNGRLLVGEHTGVYAPELNETTTHEMAHGFFMRHAHTNTDDVSYTPAGGGAAATIQLVRPRRNCFPEDHDQEYAFKCTMNYLQEEQFCAGCALTLRFADRVEIQKQNRFQDRLMRGFFEDSDDNTNTAKIVRARRVGGVLRLNETIPNLPHTGANNKMYLMAVGPLRRYRAAGADRTGRVNLSCAHDRPASLWRSSNPGILSIRVIDPLAIQVEGKGAGTATVTYSRNGKSVSADITVT